MKKCKCGRQIKSGQGTKCGSCRWKAVRAHIEDFRPLMTRIPLTNKKEWNLINRNEVAK